MSKLLLSALALALIVVPLAQGQQQAAHTVSIDIQGLPASGLSNGTSLVVPFQVHATVGGAPPCFSASGSSSYTIELAATVTNSTGNSTTVNVNPRQITIAGPVLLPAVPTSSAERTEDATLVVNAGPYSGDALNATVHITATFSGSSGGCQGVPAAASSSDEADFRANFEPVRGFGSTETSGNEMPGPALAIVLLALVAVAMVARRFS